MKVSQKLGFELTTSSCSQLDDNQLSCLPEALEELQQLQQLRLRCSQTHSFHTILHTHHPEGRPPGGRSSVGDTAAWTGPETPPCSSLDLEPGTAPEEPEKTKPYSRAAQRLLLCLLVRS